MSLGVELIIDHKGLKSGCYKAFSGSAFCTVLNAPYAHPPGGLRAVIALMKKQELTMKNTRNTKKSQRKRVKKLCGSWQPSS